MKLTKSSDSRRATSADCCCTRARAKTHGREGKTGDERDRDGGVGDHPRAVAPHESIKLVGATRRPGDNRLAREMTTEIPHQSVGGGIATRAVLFQTAMTIQSRIDTNIGEERPSPWWRSRHTTWHRFLFNLLAPFVAEVVEVKLTDAQIELLMGTYGYAH